MVAKKKAAPQATSDKAFMTGDSFANYEAAVGINTKNSSAAGTYQFDMLSKNRSLLDAMYRSSWIVGAACDAIADDMTQSGITIISENDPDDINLLQEQLDDLKIWNAFNDAIKWSRLYGSACAVILIEGQKLDTPLKIDSVGKGQFQGLLVLDRWSLQPSFDDLIGMIPGEFSPDIGMPRFYRCLPDSILPNLGIIHHSRMLRFDCVKLPHFQRMQENLWSEPIIERIHDRILAFDSTTQGAAQLVYKAYLRRWSVYNLRQIIQQGGTALRGLMKNIKLVARTEVNEGITVIDDKDKIETTNYTFSGLDDILTQFGQQLSGAIEIPLVRLFGQTPRGLNNTGESDLRTYYLNIKKKQESQLKAPIKKVLEIISRSLLQKPLPDGFGFEFNNLWQLNESEKATIAGQNVTSIQVASDANLISQSCAMKELQQQSAVTGMFSNITEEDIEAAEDDIPTAQELMEAQQDLITGDPESETDVETGDLAWNPTQRKVYADMLNYNSKGRRNAVDSLKLKNLMLEYPDVAVVFKENMGID